MSAYWLGLVHMADSVGLQHECSHRKHLFKHLSHLSSSQLSVFGGFSLSPNFCGFPVYICASSMSTHLSLFSQTRVIPVGLIHFYWKLFKAGL